MALPGQPAAKRLGDMILAPLADRAHIHDAGLLEHAQMFGSIVLGNVKLGGEIVHAEIGCEERLEDALPGAIGERFQNLSAINGGHAWKWHEFALVGNHPSKYANERIKANNTPPTGRPYFPMILFLFLAACFLAYTNGANDNFKGVASLYGSGTAVFRTALAWGTATTFAGSVTAIFLAESLLKKFSGKGLVSDALTQSPNFLLAVALGAAITVLLATRFGFPISTTHGLTGALVGAGLVSGDRTVNFAALGKNFLQPLILSPILAVVAGAVVYLLLKAARLAPDHRTRTLHALHFLSGGAVGFARGLNDTPKIAALLLVAKALDIRWTLVSVAGAMAVGGLLNARRVAETMATKITNMNPGQGFAANVTTALLVTTANWNGLPVSTTHVSVGSLLGIGIVTRQAKWKSVAQIGLSWIVTLPCAAVLAAIGALIFARH
jgi:PiT family inorganic phosphate transporter